MDLQVLLQNATGEKDHRPWGWYLVLADLPYTKVKLIYVNPGQRLSYQSHKLRAEHWVVVAGVLRATIDDVTKDYPYGQSVYIPRGAKHRMACPEGGEALQIIEVQVGDEFPESDIIRYDDDHGRV
jgi:mannose-6-phosphate isomerase-like protein (cupin superfamily)